MDGVSIIVPAYRAQNFIGRCISSIERQAVTFEYEILIGVDGCESTLSYLKNNAYAKNVRIFYFKENKGPYVVKNSLTTECKYDYILFFDADDELNKDMLEQFHKLIQKVPLVKLTYVNFYMDKRDKHSGIKNDALFGVNKKKFLEVNGFYGWKCSADTEFVKRAQQFGWPHLTMSGISYHRFLHGNNLTMVPATNFSSDTRKGYDRIIRTKRFHPPSLETQPYEHVENKHA